MNMKLLLLLLLLTTNGAWGAPKYDYDCTELYEILLESVESEYIKKHEAQSIYKRCLAVTR